MSAAGQFFGFAPLRNAAISSAFAVHFALEAFSFAVSETFAAWTMSAAIRLW